MEIEELLNKLSPRQRQIIKLRADGYSYKEIGEKLGIKEHSVDNEIQRLRRRVRGFAP